MDKAAAAKENYQDIQKYAHFTISKSAGKWKSIEKAITLMHSPQKKRLVFAKMAKEVGLTVRDQASCQSQKVQAM